ncbi:DUF503 domain-containing protein [candidate division WOR-3 bacterium]|jgi:uncharacterized protein YlxP (DUF503 family)|nr:DUF503 domain-containing protein [candidate division WOR-3 bacterium]
MFIGIGRVEIFLPGLNSLKSKRRVINSIKGKIRSKFNVGVSEIDFLDKWQRASIGIVGVSNDSKFLQSSLNKIVNQIREFRDINILDWSIKINNDFETEKSKFVYNENSP